MEPQIYKKTELVNNLLNKVIFYDNTLYKISSVNTRNIYCNRYFFNSVMVFDTSLIFYSIGKSITYINFTNKKESKTTILKLKDIIDNKYIILHKNYFDDDETIKNIYFVNDSERYIILKENYKESLFYKDPILLRNEFTIKYFINSMNSPFFKTNDAYYNKIYNEKLTNFIEYIHKNKLNENDIKNILMNTSENDIIYNRNINFYDEFLKLNVFYENFIKFKIEDA